MEQLPINDGCGQSFGFVMYRKHALEPKKLMFPGTVRDRATVCDSLPCIAISVLATTTAAAEAEAITHSH